eukprot:TRINITY_DN10272_c0_g5_i1.p1 TRINITY_DN10272_c0_g5~~TRINITY_DN10272_c0_g5_i1.p1  ORF type:complete len:198 (-),score=38.74 TRINITY_DN10272_c0_g5_i1:135-728(-)
MGGCFGCRKRSERRGVADMDEDLVEAAEAMEAEEVEPPHQIRLPSLLEPKRLPWQKAKPISISAGESCAICLEEVRPSIVAEHEAVRQLPCGHVFHAACVGKWLQHSGSCPYRCVQPASALKELVEERNSPPPVDIGSVPVQDVDEALGDHDAPAFLASNSRRSAAFRALQLSLGRSSAEIRSMLQLQWLRRPTSLN